MRIGILVNSLPAAVKILGELKAVRDCEALVLLCPSSDGSRGLWKHAARFLLKRGRMTSLPAIMGRRVVRLRQALDHPETLARLKSLALDVGLHKSGDIYRDAAIKCFRLGILNPHIGILPRYRGRNVMEWAVLHGDPVGITVFFIDEGIDTGARIVLSEEVDISDCTSIQEAKQRLFDSDAVFFRRALELIDSEDFEYGVNDGSGRRHYVMSKLFCGVVERQLAVGSGQLAVQTREDPHP